jgi:AraC-like DNA-binding protein
MQKAMVFLMETDLNIDDIAYDLGFNSVTNFCVRFKKIVGVSPNDFRKINKSKKWLNN